MHDSVDRDKENTQDATGGVGGPSGSGDRSTAPQPRLVDEMPASAQAHGGRTAQGDSSGENSREVTFDFTGRRVIITGAAGGIGRELAKLFRQAGADLALADLSVDALDAAVSALPQGSGTVLTVPYNGADPESAQHLVDVVTERFGGIDVLVPAAGIYPRRAVAEMSDEEWRQVMSINLDGVFTLVRRALPSLGDRAAIVLFASVAGHRGSRLHAHYAASKAGIIALTRSLALELGPEVRVNAVSPGTIMTPMVGDLVKDRGEAMLRDTPLRRNGEPMEVARAVAFLASDAASFITGETLHVNGGLFMAG